MYYSRLKTIRKEKGITLEGLSEMTKISVRIPMSFGK